MSLSRQEALPVCLADRPGQPFLRYMTYQGAHGNAGPYLTLTRCRRCRRWHCGWGRRTR